MRNPFNGEGTLLTVRASGESGVINKDIQKDAAKVVDTLSVKDIDGKCVMCRCWRSSTFPKCDGSHVAHNKATGDNVGPLIISE
jgi:CDGSH-type Zn-finger protein